MKITLHCGVQMATRHLPPTATVTRRAAFLTLTAISFPLYGYPAPTANSYRYPSRGFPNTYRHQLPTLWLPGTRHLPPTATGTRRVAFLTLTAISFPLFGYPAPTANSYR